MLYVSLLWTGNWRRFNNFYCPSALYPKREFLLFSFFFLLLPFTISDVDIFRGWLILAKRFIQSHNKKLTERCKEIKLFNVVIIFKFIHNFFFLAVAVLQRKFSNLSFFVVSEAIFQHEPFKLMAGNVLLNDRKSLKRIKLGIWQ